MLTIDNILKVMDEKIEQVNPSKIYVLAIRGNEGPNKIGVFDDRAYVVYDSTLKGTWKMNTDPSSQIPGRATLVPNVIDMIAKKHHINDAPPLGRAAFGQAEAVTVDRYHVGLDKGWFGINIHDALNGTTSSAGCQTFEPKNWATKAEDGFRDVMYRLLKITPAQVMAHPSGFGDTFKYILATATEVNGILR